MCLVLLPACSSVAQFDQNKIKQYLDVKKAALATLLTVVRRAFPDLLLLTALDSDSEFTSWTNTVERYTIELAGLDFSCSINLQCFYQLAYEHFSEYEADNLILDFLRTANGWVDFLQGTIAFAEQVAVNCYTEKLSILAQQPASLGVGPTTPRVTSASASLLGAVTGFKQVLTQQLSSSAAWAATLAARESDNITYCVGPKLVQLGRLNMLNRPAFRLEPFCSIMRRDGAAHYSVYIDDEDNFTEFSPIRLPTQDSSALTADDAAAATSDAAVSNAAVSAAAGVSPANSISSLESGEIPSFRKFSARLRRMLNARTIELGSMQD